MKNDDCLLLFVRINNVIFFRFTCSSDQNEMVILIRK